MNKKLQEIGEIGKGMLSQSKFYMGYSRWDDANNRYESWEESVARVMHMHREKYKDKLNPELEELITFAQKAYEEKLILGAQRALQFGGEQLFKHEARMYNCLKDTTKFVTSAGVKDFTSFNDCDTLKVLTHAGNWKNAVVRQHGVQQLFKIEFIKSGSKPHVVEATANHRWILKDGTETTNLKIGDIIYKPENTFGEFNYDKATPQEKLYWCYGMVYGDGTKVKSNGEYKYSLIRLCGGDKQFAGRFEEMNFKTSTSDSLTGDFIAYTGTYLKTAPNPEIDSPELIRAFCAGYLQADGEKNSNQSGTQYLTIQSSEQDHIDFIRKCFPIAGVWIISETDLTGQTTNFGTRPYTISFRISDSMGSKYNQGWVVKDITPSTEEVVWCLEVEDDHSFVLPNGIVTGNCTVSHVDRPRFFQEAMYMLLCGCGVGFSVQTHHIEKLPLLKKRSEKKSKVFTVPDSIEGWADAFGVLLASYFDTEGDFKEYKGCQVHFDFSKVRPKGAMISGGFKAPGPDGLRQSLQKCEELLDALFEGGEQFVKLPSIAAYDFVMHMSDAVLSGGVRRSATICMFSKDDKDMLNAKTGDWFITNPQRGRSNNSVMLLRDDVTRDEWAEIMKSVRQVGEPGFIFTDNLEFCYNPCVEIGMLPTSEKGESGFQVCNLTETNGGKCTDKESLLRASKASAILGTLQAGYTNFKYLTDASKDIIEREALIGVSITGWMNNPDVLFNEDNMKEAAEEVKKWNKVVAGLIGINPAARCTAVKPSGNASVLLGTASGIHGEHSPLYFRNVQMNDQDDVLALIQKTNPEMIEDSVWSSTGTDKVVSFPVVSKEGSIYKHDLLGVKQLEYVKAAQQVWIEYGTNLDLCVDKNLRHNVSNTITVDDWDEVEEYIYNNREWFAGISLLSSMGDKAYPQAPFTEVFTSEQILKKYGDASLLASGLIIDALHAFNNNLWVACDTVNGWGEKLDETKKEDLLKRDWVRRANKFSTNYFNSDVLEMTNCLKDCFNLHKWCTISNGLQKVDFSNELQKKSFVEVDTLAGAACAGGACEVGF